MTGRDWAATGDDFLAQRFEERRPQLRAIAYRMLGSLHDADDAVQDTWVRVSRADTGSIENLDAWLTTIVARVCLNQLRRRSNRREAPLVHVPDPIISRDSGVGPEEAALLADGVGLALLVVLDSLSPNERVAFVLHDTFGVSFAEIGTLLDRTPEAARQLASRARRRVQEQSPPPDPDLARQRDVVDAFFAASREGDLDALVAVLHPDVVLRSDGGAARPAMNLVVRGAEHVARQATLARQLTPFVHRVLVNGAPGVVVVPQRRLQVVMAFTTTDGQITAIDVLLDPERLARLDLSTVLG